MKDILVNGRIWILSDPVAVTTSDGDKEEKAISFRNFFTEFEIPMKISEESLNLFYNDSSKHIIVEKIRPKVIDFLDLQTDIKYDVEFQIKEIPIIK